MIINNTHYTLEHVIDVVGHVRARALAMREAGLSLKAIANSLGTNRVSAGRMIKKAERDLADPASYDELSVLSKKTQNVLRNAGYQSRHQVRLAVAYSVLHPDLIGNSKTKRYGPKTHVEVCKWLGIK